MVKIAMPVSKLFSDKNVGMELAVRSDILELRGYKVPIPLEDSYLYHARLNLLAKWNNRLKRELKKINKKYKIDLFSTHALSRYQHNIIGKGEVMVGVGNPFSDTEMKKNVKDNCETLKSIFGKVSICSESSTSSIIDSHKRSLAISTAFSSISTPNKF